MSGVVLVFAKELLELVRAPRTLLFTFLLPAAAYPALVGVLASLDAREMARLNALGSRVCLSDPDGVLASAMDGAPSALSTEPCPEDPRRLVEERQLDLVIAVDPGAGARLARREPVQVRLEYDGAERRSAMAAERFRAALARQDERWVEARFQDLGLSPEVARPTTVHVAWSGDPGRTAAQKFGAILPYVLLFMMFAGSMQHGIYVTAGDRERGTLLALLATRVPRSQVIAGKLLYVFSVGLASAGLNLVSLLVSLRRAGEHAAAAWTAGGGAPEPRLFLDPAHALLAFALLLPAGLLFANVIVFVGIRARSSVEAGTALSPLVFAIAGLAVVSSSSAAPQQPFLAWVPIANVSLALRKMFSTGAVPVEYGTALAMTVALAAGLTWASVRALDRDSALFRG